MVSVAVLTILFLGLVKVFNMTSEAAGRTAAHADLLAASANVHQTLADELSHVVPGLLIIESPPPTPPRAEWKEGQRVFRLRHDRLVFIAARGAENPYESVTDPTRGTVVSPDLRPASSSEALVYFGPGIPVVGDGTAAGEQRQITGPTADPTLTASEWMYLHRAILLMTADPGVPGWDPPDSSVFLGGSGMLQGGALPQEFFDGSMDAVAPMNSTELITAIAQLAPSQLLRADPDIAALWEPSLAPVTVSYDDPADADYYRRAGFVLAPRLAGFTVEWTDGGRVDPMGPDGTPDTGDENLTTRWFGLAPAPLTVDATNQVDLSDPSALRFQARLRSVADPLNPSRPRIDNPDDLLRAGENEAFGNRIEWSPFGVVPNVDAQYRAVWRGDDYAAFGPKALRLTYRIYDKNRRLRQPVHVDLNADGVIDDDPMTGEPYNVVRFGQQFSVVVPLK